ncbi:hypothetical protein O181_040904 [Austropuccinia psidii MF-1]|uniref:Uncharacterized protein n=1 Tax=Austropuccinia psidii MF-1 TaxID=1389203 RepID=A0A9Q3HG00_9BASI|nr:hypothetical protein [Austropuccinia psidii MF-1]
MNPTYQVHPNDLALFCVQSGYYVTQTFESWLRWLLLLDGIEDQMNRWSEDLSAQSDGTLIDIQQGTSWKEIIWKTKAEENNSLQLCFSLFIDWFNPRHNKLAGKQESIGIVCMACLNLPPLIRNKFENVFIAGLMPGPQAPDMTTIGHLMSPLVDDLLHMQGPFTIPKFNSPGGRIIETRLLTLIGDSGARHKVGGFASHSANYMCPWCMIKDSDLGKIQLGPSRNGGEVRRLGDDWKRATKNQRNVLMRGNGIQFSELNRLEYRDPVKHMAIGMMHNWMEGILAHHFRERWAFQELEYYQTKRKLVQSQRNQSTKRPRIDVNEESDGGGIEEDEDEENDDDIELNEGEKGGLFTKEFRQAFRDKMKGLVLPEELGNLPKNLGSPKHVFITDVNNINKESNCFKVVQNASLLVRCTNLLLSAPLRQDTGLKFTKAYVKYQQTSKEIFSTFKIQPNHHYALHVEEQMQWFGPLGGVAEFWGECLVGLLQNLNTNEKFGEMEMTMLTKMISQQRLAAEHPLDKWLRPEERAEGLRKTTRMHVKGEYYDQLLAYVRARSNQTIRSRHEVPHPMNALILSGTAISKRAWTDSKGRKFSPMQPHNCIMFRHLGLIHYGLITEILEFEHPLGQTELALAVNPIQNCYAKDLTSPTKTFQFFCYLMKVIIGKILDDRYFINIDQIGSLMAYRKLDPDTFQIPNQGIIMVPVDKLGYLQINEDSSSALY